MAGNGQNLTEFSSFPWSKAEFLEKKHTTILYSCETVGEKIKVNSDFTKTIEEIKSNIKK